MADQDYGRLLRGMVAQALRHPRLIPLLVGAAWRFRRRGWYRHSPFLPLPPPDYIKWRLYTAYGSEVAVPQAAELARYLRWSASLGKRAPTVPRREIRAAATAASHSSEAG